MNLNFLRRRPAESSTVAALRADLDDTQRSLARCRITLHTVRAQLRGNEARYRDTELHNAMLADEVAALRALVALPREPGQPVQCNKVRLRNHDEATEFARRVEHDRQLTAGTLTGYGCDDCPRQPVSLTKFWHITNTVVAMRGPSTAKAGRRGPGLATHVSPADVARLHAKTRGAVHG